MPTAPKTAPVQISKILHTAVVGKVAELSKSSGKRVTITALIETAILIAYPDLGEPVASAASEAAEQQAAAQLDSVMAALYCSSDPVEVNAAIEQLDGSVQGSAGQPIKLRDLAYHLRSTQSAIGSMRELIADYEGGGR